MVATYLAHAWMAAIALTWVFVLVRRFPVGGLDFRQLRPWYVLSLVITAGNAIVAFASPPGRLHVNLSDSMMTGLTFPGMIELPG